MDAIPSQQVQQVQQALPSPSPSTVVRPSTPQQQKATLKQPASTKQQPLIQQQERRNLALIPPFRYGVVEEDVFRGAYPKDRNLRFLKRLSLKTILSLTPDPPRPELVQFCLNQKITSLHIRVDKPKDAIPLTFNKVSQILAVVIDPANLPIYIHCLDGAIVTGILVACLRKLQCWAIPSAMIEFSRYMRDGVIESEESEFVEKFQTEMEIPKTLPKWLSLPMKKHPTLKVRLPPQISTQQPSQQQQGQQQTNQSQLQQGQQIPQQQGSTQSPSQSQPQQQPSPSLTTSLSSAAISIPMLPSAGSMTNMSALLPSPPVESSSSSKDPLSVRTQHAPIQRTQSHHGFMEDLSYSTNPTPTTASSMGSRSALEQWYTSQPPPRSGSASPGIPTTALQTQSQQQLSQQPQPQSTQQPQRQPSQREQVLNSLLENTQRQRNHLSFRGLNMPSPSTAHHPHLLLQQHGYLPHGMNNVGGVNNGNNVVGNQGLSGGQGSNGNNGKEDKNGEMGDREDRGRGEKNGPGGQDDEDDEDEEEEEEMSRTLQALALEGLKD